MGYKITIDGPSGSGKGFVAHEISKRLNILNIDTGAMYRAFGLFVLENNTDINDTKEIEKVLPKIKIYFKENEKGLRVYLNETDVSEKIRNEEVGTFATKVSGNILVRNYMVNAQREIANNKDVIMEGRDIGSVVFPNAQLKIFLTADVNIRARRRLKDLEDKGYNISFDEVLASIKKRDESDIKRSISPLKKTSDMIEIDTTNMTKEQVIDKVLSLVYEKGLVNFESI